MPCKNAVRTSIIRGRHPRDASSEKNPRRVARAAVGEVLSTVSLSGSSKPRATRRALRRGVAVGDSGSFGGEHPAGGQDPLAPERHFLETDRSAHVASLSAMAPSQAWPAVATGTSALRRSCRRVARTACADADERRKAAASESEPATARRGRTRAQPRRRLRRAPAGHYSVMCSIETSYRRSAWLTASLRGVGAQAPRLARSCT